VTGVNIRRLAAIDMYGGRGAVSRRRLVLAEFAAGLLVMEAFGGWVLVRADSVGAWIFGAWILGAGLNYGPLTVHALALSRAGALEAELAEVDTRAELRHYGLLQLWILVPLALLAMSLRHRRSEPRP
jgi:hypothetical protein